MTPPAYRDGEFRIESNQASLKAFLLLPLLYEK